MIGHEMGHGFDDQGRHFDETGKVRDWWTPDAAKAFGEHADRLGKQFDGHDAGRPACTSTASSPWARTSATYEAAWKPPTPPSAAMWPSTASRRSSMGFTGDQRFFIACCPVPGRPRTREGALRQQLLTNPAQRRPSTGSGGIVRNVDAWYAAFNVQARRQEALPAARPAGARTSGDGDLVPWRPEQLVALTLGQPSSPWPARRRWKLRRFGAGDRCKSYQPAAGLPGPRRRARTHRGRGDAAGRRLRGQGRRSDVQGKRPRALRSGGSDDQLAEAAASWGAAPRHARRQRGSVVAAEAPEEAVRVRGARRS